MFVKTRIGNRLVNLDTAKEIYISRDLSSDYVIRACYTDGTEIDIIYSKKYDIIVKCFNELIKRIQAKETCCNCLEL